MRLSYFILTSFLVSPVTEAVVIYQDIEDVNIFSQMQNETDFDINSDGENDLKFRHNQGDLGAIGIASNRIVATAVAPPDLGADVTPLLGGTMIDSSLVPPLTWWVPSVSREYGNFISCRNIGCIGLWGNLTSFVGVEFEIDGNTHYGWIEVNTPGDLGWGIIQRLAWEDEPNKGIQAGAVPEPSSSAMVGLGLAIILCKRRR